MSTSAEKLVKQTIKLIAKTQDLEYEELKIDAKKLIKAARVYDDSIFGMMEEMMDISNVSSPEELEDFNIEVLKIYCRIKELDDSGSDKSIRNRVWQNMEEEFEVGDSDDDSDDGPEIEEVEDSEPEPEPEPVKVKSRKPKAEKELVIIG
jgi:hypothetical protein